MATSRPACLPAPAVPGLRLLLRLAVMALFAIFAAASSAVTSTATSSPTATVFNTTAYATAAANANVVRRYAYQGCFLEVTGTNGTAPGSRSLENGPNEVLPGNMTVPKCLAFCGNYVDANGTTTAYPYAGLEYSRECWCGEYLAALATLEPAAACNLPCDGDSGMLCGGDLRLTVYALSGAAPTASTRLWLAAAGTIAVFLVEW